MMNARHNLFPLHLYICINSYMYVHLCVHMPVHHALYINV